jgi:REP element-mobilizing transposase RayT
MPRRKRCSSPLAVLHLSARGIDGAAIFLDDFDRFAFVTLLRRVTERAGWTVLAWCLMDTHYHLLVIATEEPRVGWAMQLLNGTYAREFNLHHVRRGHLFGGRYSETVIADERHLQAANDYVLDNPVRAGLVRLAGDWPWSGDGRLEPRDVEQVVRLRPQRRDVLVRSRG